LIEETRDMLMLMSEALKNTQSTVSYIVSIDSNSGSSPTTASANVNSWLGTINTDLANIMSVQMSIADAEKTLDDLVQGPDELEIRSGKLSLLQSENTYAEYFLRSPFDGTIAKVSAKEGEASNGSAVATVISDERVVEVSLNEIDAATVKVGQKAVLVFDAVANLRLHGEVTEVDLVGTVTQGVATYGIKISLGDGDSKIKPGMTADISITTETKSDVLVVPNSAIKTQGKASYVEIPSTSSVPDKKMVEIGLADDSNTEIRNGLAEGDKIISRTIQTSAITAPTSGASSLRIPGLTGGSNVRTGSTAPVPMR
jgi:RND family efflux transporter MFP subunit